MRKWMIAGIGTDVGKTVAAAILMTLLQGDYWKPVECGQKEDSDSVRIKKLITTNGSTNRKIHPPIYSLKGPLSPHHAARLENSVIDVNAFILPKTDRPLIIEGVGGILVPLTNNSLTIDLFKKWECQWVVISKHYLGSINHTLLTLEVLKQRQIPVLGLIFNGEPNLDSEKAILEIAQLPLLGRIFPEQSIDRHTIQKYAKQWKSQISWLAL